MQSDQRNAIFAVVLSGLILFGWQTFFAPKPAPTSTQTSQKTETSSNRMEPAISTAAEVAAADPTSSIHTLEKSGIKLSFNSTLSFTGMINPQASLSFDEVVSAKKSMQVLFSHAGGFTPLQFETVESNIEKWVGVNREHSIQAVVLFTDIGAPRLSLKSDKTFRYKLAFEADPKSLENKQERKFAYYSDDLNLVAVGKEDQGDSAVSWAGVDFNYHLFAISFDQPKNLLHESQAGNKFVLFTNQDTQETSFNFYFVKKEYDYLASLGRNLKSSVDFGMWGFFAVWILRGLQFFYEFFPNYGIAIILITFAVRLLTFPLQYKSFVGMKKLQEIQPEITKIREKFKDDPVKLQKETMELFKKSGANPLGGCLPLLLQMPIFIAFYQVLSHSVELVDAPFFGWIHDLSNKDPYYVIPLLVAGSMFLQQKLTPSTVADPVQRKVLLFMPLIFGFMMKDLPSGLSLYFFFSTSLGILQQILVFNTKNKTAKA
jgi:YidC/Oxa1 family membrane protein insertase